MPSALESWLSLCPAYQLRWIYEPAKFAVVVKSRQIGFSFATAAAAVKAGFFDKRTQIILSASQDLSDEVLAKAKAHCETLADFGKRGALNFSVENSTELAWKTGGRILALPANPRTARSYSGDVHLDEFAYHADPEGIREAVFPMVSRPGLRLRVISTPNGAQGLFYDWSTDPPRDWAVHRVTIDDASADGFKVNREDLFHSAAGGDERLFGQWFLCRFLDADLQYFPTALVKKCHEWGERPNFERAELFAGLDVGRDHDLTALTVVAVLDGCAWHISTMTCKRTAFADQKQMIRDARRTFHWSTLHVDETGIGRQLAEELVDEYGEDEVQPMTFTNAKKADLVTRSLRWIRDERVKLSKDHEGQQLASEIMACRRTVTPSGNVVFDVPRSSSGHGDRFWSWALAMWGAGEPVAPRGLGLQPLLAVA